MTWMASITGRPVELLRPRVEEVNFADMAQALSHLNRYGGHALSPVSVAHHLIIGCDNAPEALRPWWLLHDTHEERTGDVTAPVKETYAALAAEMLGPDAAAIVEQVRLELERRHDAVIHQAAGLPLPTEAQKRAIKLVDLAALATERRDFHAEQRRAWFIDNPIIAPFKRAYRWKPPAVVAEELHRRFARYLPSLSGKMR